MNCNLAVITGLNGCGKTSMLKYIHEEASQNHKVFFKTQSIQRRKGYRMHQAKNLRDHYYESQIPTFDEIMEYVYDVFTEKAKDKYIHRHDVFSALFDSRKLLYSEVGYDLLEEICELLGDLSEIDAIKKKLGVPTEEQIKNKVIEKLNKDDFLKKEYNYRQGKRFYKQHKTEKRTTRMPRYVPNESQEINELEDEAEHELKMSLRKNSIVNSKESFESFIHNLVLNYSFSIESIIEKMSKRIYEESKGKISKGNKLWERINTEIQTNHSEHFNYIISSPNGFSSNYEISFQSVEDNHKHVHFDSLSSGEKVIFELLCYYLIANKDSDLELMIFDEFDANLNPALVDEYIKVIKRQFCDNNIRVILTTHSPSTIAALDPKEIYELFFDDGVQKINCADSEDGKKQILKKLAPKFVYYSEFGNLEYVLNDHTGRIVLIEGKKDFENLSDIDGFTFVHCEGADNIKNLLICFKSIEFFKNILKGKLLIALFDFDAKGRAVIKDLLKPDSDDAFTRKIDEKKSPYIYDKENNFYIATFEPLPAEDKWDYTNQPVEHSAIKNNNNLLKKQQQLLSSILEDWENL